MYNRTITDNNNIEYIRIDKRKARTLYNAGNDLIICASNLRPFGFWNPQTEININYFRKDFETLINEYQFYNCSNSETGYFVSFYIKKEVVNNE